MSRHLISTRDLSRDQINEYIRNAEIMRQMGPAKKNTNQEQPILGLLFYEASTRTSSSFQAAMAKLGGTSIMVNSSYSSSQKGETLEDTIRTMECYCDAIVLRHPERGSSKHASKVATKPLINAGDGDGEHPTQALLDLYTIYRELGQIKNQTVTFVGDLKHSRTIHSLIYSLSLYEGMTFIYVSPPGLEMPESIIQEVGKKNISQIQNISLEKAITMTDVLYMTRIQKERSNITAISSIILTPELMKSAKELMIVMHPLPRTDEIELGVDADPRAVYFRQVENGLYMRMAILDTCLR